MRTEKVRVRISGQSPQLQLWQSLQALRSLRFRLFKILSMEVCKQPLKILSIQICKQICSFATHFSLSFSATSGVSSIQYLTVHAKRSPEFVVQILDICATQYRRRDLFHQCITKPIYQWPSANKKKYHLFKQV